MAREKVDLTQSPYEEIVFASKKLGEAFKNGNHQHMKTALFAETTDGSDRLVVYSPIGKGSIIKTLYQVMKLAAHLDAAMGAPTPWSQLDDKAKKLLYTVKHKNKAKKQSILNEIVPLPKNGVKIKTKAGEIDIPCGTTYKDVANFLFDAGINAFILKNIRNIEKQVAVTHTTTWDWSSMV